MNKAIIYYNWKAHIQLLFKCHPGSCHQISALQVILNTSDKPQVIGQDWFSRQNMPEIVCILYQLQVH